MQTFDINQLKKDAKRLKKAHGITHSEALDKIAIQHGFDNWSLLSKNAGHENLTVNLLSKAIDEALRYKAFSLIDRNIHTPSSQVNKDNLPDIHVAALNNRLDLIQELLDANVDINVAHSEDGLTALHCIIGSTELQIETLEFLLKNGASVHSQTRHEATPLHLYGLYLTKKVPTEMINVDNELSVARLLLEAGANPHASSICLPSPFSLAIAHRPHLAKLFMEYGYDCHEKDEHGKTFLHLTAYHGSSYESLKLLLEKGVNMDEKDENGETALMLACKTKRNDFVELLLNSGADLYLEDNKGKTCLHHAAEHGNPKIIKLLLDRGVDIQKIDYNGSSALHYSAGNGHVKATDLLIKRGVQVNQKNNDGYTPLMIAKKRNAYDAIDFLEGFPKKDSGPIKLAMLGFDSKNYKSMAMLLASQREDVISIADAEYAQIVMIDVNTFPIWDEKFQKAKADGKVVIAVGTDPIVLVNVVYLEKPFMARSVKKAIETAIRYLGTN